MVSVCPVALVNGVLILSGIYGSDPVGGFPPSLSNSHPNRHADLVVVTYRGALLCDAQVVHSTGGLLDNRLI